MNTNDAEYDALYEEFVALDPTTENLPRAKELIHAMGAYKKSKPLGMHLAGWVPVLKEQGWKDPSESWLSRFLDRRRERRNGRKG